MQQMRWRPAGAVVVLEGFIPFTHEVSARRPCAGWLGRLRAGAKNVHRDSILQQHHCTRPPDPGHAATPSSPPRAS